MHLTYNAINSQYAVKQSLPIYSWGCLNFTLRYSCFSLRSKWGDLEGYYAFNAKELDEENGMYYYSARYYAPPTFISRDPLFEKYPSISPYAYCANNPVLFIDPDGRSTRVAKNEDGTYRVIGGDLTDKDYNIYVYTTDEDGNYTVKGESIGVTTSLTSFYNSDENSWMGVIRPNDNTGRDFLNKDIIDADPPIGYYMDNAKTGQRYDFKVTNGTNIWLYDKVDDYYRGMPLGKNNKGNMIYSSARDIGNIAAGYVAGVHAVPWKMVRKEFDKLESTQKGFSSVEGISSQNAQRVGWEIGHSKAPAGLIPRLWRSRAAIKKFIKRK